LNILFQRVQNAKSLGHFANKKEGANGRLASVFENGVRYIFVPIKWWYL